MRYIISCFARINDLEIPVFKNYASVFIFNKEMRFVKYDLWLLNISLIQDLSKVI